VESKTLNTHLYTTCSGPGRSQTTSNGVATVRAVEEGEEPNDPYERWEVGQIHTSEETDEQR